MKTDQLIEALVADRTVRVPGPARALAMWLLPAAAVAFVLLQATLGVRTDIAFAMETWRFLLKIVILATLAVTAGVLAWHAAHPTAQVSVKALAVPVMLLLTGLLVEAFLVPGREWAARAIGSNALSCLIAIPLYSMVPLASALLALRQGAPANPALAGGLAGLVAAGIGSFFYSLHCFDDSPFFVTLWYPLGIAFVTAIGTILGSRFLRW